VPEDNGKSNGLGRLGILASAISGYPLEVSAVAPGEPAWTDSRVVYVDDEQSKRHQLEALAVQASLLAQGSLAPEILRRLKRRSTATQRYLAVEAHRALAANEDLLPPFARSLIDRDVATRTDSPDASLALALSRESIAEPPGVFGTIRARNVLAAMDRAAASTAPGEHIPRRQRKQELEELDDDANQEADDIMDVFSSPVGGAGVMGRLLQKMLGMVRQISGGGPPGADAPTHKSRWGARGGGRSVVSAAQASAFEEAFGEGHGTTYPEWDVHRRRYRPDWCTVIEVEPHIKADTSAGFDSHGLRRPLARLGLGLDRVHRQAGGDDIDIDAAVEAQVETLAGSAPDEAVYIDTLRLRRDLAVMVLLDISGSVAEPGTTGHNVHDQQRAGAAALTTTLHDLGDRVALYAFHSQGRSAVNLMPVKRFDGDLDITVMRRLRGLVPGAYSRLGAAIRHGTAVLEREGGAPRRLLVVLSDGLAYDHGYERVYGAADARRALAEARRRGTGCLCLTIGAATDVDELRRVFGSAAHATIPKPEQMSQMIGPLFRSAIRSAEVRRRVA
jgi:nitric oxide reductase NorD protein